MKRNKLDHLPGFAVLVGVALLAVATTRYPGGFDAGEHTLSELFAPEAASGAENPARLPAVLGVLSMLAGMALLFELLSRSATSKLDKQVIQIGGIGAMVYAALTVTPMHDLMVTIGLAFFLAMMLGVLHMLFAERRTGWFALGLLCLAIKLGSAVLYYGDVQLELLPWAQKFSILLTLVWLFAVHFRHPETVNNDQVNVRT